MKKESRKSFLQRSAAGLAGLGLVATTACVDDPAPKKGEAPAILKRKPIRWKMVTTWPPNFPILGEGCALMAQWVAEMSDGMFEIEVFGGGELVPPLEAFDAVRIGAAQIGNGAGYYWAGKMPAAQFFATVPFGMNAQQMNAWLLKGGGLDLWHEVYEPFGVFSWPAGNTGVQMGGWFNRKIESLDSLKGLKMRMPGLGGKALTRVGGTAVNVAGGEIYTNLERGVIDATEWIGPYHDYIMGFHKIARYYYYPGWHEPGTTLETFINRKKFNELPKSFQVILETATQRQNSWTLAAFEAQNAAYLDKIKAESEVEILHFPPEVLDALRAATREVLVEICDKDPVSAKVYEAYQAFQQQSYAWAGLTERPYHQELSVLKG